MEEQSFMRITGMPQAISNVVTRDIRFALTIEDQASPLFLIARYGIAQQVASGLGTCIQALRADLDRQGGWEAVSPERIRETRIQKDQFSDALLIELITEPLGIPYVFQLPTQIASVFADLLKNEASKQTRTGNA